MRTPEGHEKDDIKKFLKTLGRCWFFNPYMAGFGASGVPDIVGCIDGRLFSVEVKREGKQPTSTQWKRMREIEVAGGKCFWGTSSKVLGEMTQWLLTFVKADRRSRNQARPDPASGAEPILPSQIPGSPLAGFVAADLVSPAGIGGRRSR